jgi:hypothetical protein
VGCGGTCQRCFRREPCLPDGNQNRCTQCKLDFFNPECRAAHLQPGANHGRSTCETVFWCDICKSIVANVHSKNEHLCNSAYCSLCEAVKPNGHEHFWSRLKAIDDDNPQITIYYDFETRSMPARENETFHRQEAVFCVVMWNCKACVDYPPNRPCRVCAATDNWEVKFILNINSFLLIGGKSARSRF